MSLLSSALHSAEALRLQLLKHGGENERAASNQSATDDVVKSA